MRHRTDHRLTAVECRKCRSRYCRVCGNSSARVLARPTFSSLFIVTSVAVDLCESLRISARLSLNFVQHVALSDACFVYSRARMRGESRLCTRVVTRELIKHAMFRPKFRRDKSFLILHAEQRRGFDIFRLISLPAR